MQGNGDAKMTNLDAEGNGDAAATPPLLPDIGLGRQRAWGRLGWATAGGWSSGGIHWILRWGPWGEGLLQLRSGASATVGLGAGGQDAWPCQVLGSCSGSWWRPATDPCRWSSPGGARWRSSVAARTQVLFFPSCVSGGGKDL